MSLRPLPADYEPSLVTLPSTCPMQGNPQAKVYLVFPLQFVPQLVCHTVALLAGELGSADLACAYAQ